MAFNKKLQFMGSAVSTDSMAAAVPLLSEVMVKILKNLCASECTKLQVKCTKNC